MKARTLLLVSVLFAAAEFASAQDPVKLSPNFYKVLLENEQVRVLDFRIKAGQKEPMHFHPAAVVYVLTAGKAKFIFPDGKSEIRESQAGTTLWSDAQTHAYETSDLATDMS